MRPGVGNLSIDGIHTYHVGVDKILVHNSGGVGWDRFRNEWDPGNSDDDGYNEPFPCAQQTGGDAV